MSENNDTPLDSGNVDVDVSQVKITEGENSTPSPVAKSNSEKKEEGRLSLMKDEGRTSYINNSGSDNRQSLMRNAGNDGGASPGTSNSNDSSGWAYQWELATNAINHANAKITINILSPEVVSSMMSKHVTYSVKTEPLGYNVRRRYNDFAWLRDTLCSRYVGLFVPQIPSTTIFSTKKNITGSKTDINGDFVKNRMAQLNLFMLQLCKIPFLRTDPSLIAFISVQNDKEFKQIQETPVNIVKTAVSEDTNNEGLKLWLAMLDNTSLNTQEADRAIADFKRQLEVLRNTLDTLDKECRIAGRKAMIAAQQMNTLSDHIEKWNMIENDLVDPNKNEYHNQYGAKVKMYMNALVNGQNNWAQNVSLIPKVIARVLMSSVQFQLVQVEGFRALLQQREQFGRDLERAEREKLRALEDKHRAASSGTSPKRGSVASMTAMFTKKGDELEKQVIEKTELVNSLTSSLQRSSRALMFCEMDRFYKERLQTIAQLLGCLSATHMQISQAATQKWSEVVAIAGLETGLFADSVNALYSSIDDEDIFGDA